MPQAMKLFGETLQISKLDQQYMSKPAEAENDADSKKRFDEMLGWFKYEIRQYTESDISIDGFKKHKDIITLLNGTASKLTSSFLKKLASKLSTFQVVT